MLYVSVGLKQHTFITALSAVMIHVVRQKLKNIKNNSTVVSTAYCRHAACSVFPRHATKSEHSEHPIMIR